MFGRIAKIQIGPEELDGLAVRFNVRRVPGKLDGAQLDVWGLSQDAYGQIGRSGVQTRLIAGYADAGTGLLVEGTTIRDSLRRVVQDGEVVTSWQVQESASGLARVRLSASWPSSVTAEELIRYVAGQLQVAVAPVVLPRSPTYARGYVLSGSAREALSTLASDCGCRWSIQAGRLVLTPQNGQAARVRAVVLGVGSGLIGYPESSDGGRVKVMSLLHPGIMPGDAIRVEGPTLPGDYVVEQLEHRGDLWGQDWYTALTLRVRA
jgi:hypothetical protein